MPNGHNLHELENQFYRAMLGVYESALRECGHNATRFLQMVNKHGGLQSAKRLLHTHSFQYGFTELWQCGCLRLTMEALVIQPRFSVLFTEEEVQIAKDRLHECGYDIN